MLFAILPLLAGVALSLPALAADKCKSHVDWGDLEVCHDGKCESAVGRVYTVTIVKGEVSEKKRNGKAWDASGGLPDTQVIAKFPNSKKRVATTKAARDTLKPKWNASFNITVSAAGQEIWFCFSDADAMSPDPIHVDATSGANCRGYKNVLDFIRSGEMTFHEADAEMVRFKATIRRK